MKSSASFAKLSQEKQTMATDVGEIRIIGNSFCHRIGPFSSAVPISTADDDVLLFLFNL
jgi:hypothetical protein